MAAIVCVPLLGAAQTLVITLTPSNYNGFNVSCFGLKDGTLSAAVTGGTPPYTYTWSTAETTQSISGLAAGYYHLSVKDALSAKDDAEITLTEPNTMRVAANPHVFSNDYNISCYECSNGSIQVTVADGVAPYTFLWDDGPTNQNRWGLDQGFYQVTVSDANSCEALQVGTYISRPDRSDWTMGGNTGSDPETDYIGTADEQDVVLKSNGVERLRLKSDGTISMIGPQLSEGPLFVTANGELRGGGGGEYPTLPVGCRGLSAFAYWKVTGNAFEQLCPEDHPVLGTLVNRPLEIVTNGIKRMEVDITGRVLAYNDVAIQQNLFTGVQIGADENWTGARLRVRNTTGRWISLEGTDNSAWSLLRTANALEFQYMADQWAGQDLPRLRLHNDGKVSIGQDISTPGDYLLYVANGILTEKLKVAIRSEGDWSDHVFAADYQMPTLVEVRAYIEENCHLPGIPSAAEMVHSGLDVAQSDALLLKKVEELTLYILQLESRLSELEGNAKK